MCVCDFAFRYTPSLRSVVTRASLSAITSEGIHGSSGGNKYVTVGATVNLLWHKLDV